MIPPLQIDNWRFWDNEGRWGFDSCTKNTQDIPMSESQIFEQWSDRMGLVVTNGGVGQTQSWGPSDHRESRNKSRRDWEIEYREIAKAAKKLKAYDQRQERLNSKVIAITKDWPTCPSCGSHIEEKKLPLHLWNCSDYDYLLHDYL